MVDNNDTKMLRFTQEGFAGGLNLFADDSMIADNEYSMGFNCRVRDNTFQPVKNDEILTDAPEGLKQGLYGFDELLVLFCRGRAYYRLLLC